MSNVIQALMLALCLHVHVRDFRGFRLLQHWRIIDWLLSLLYAVIRCHWV